MERSVSANSLADATCMVCHGKTCLEYSMDPRSTECSRRTFLNLHMEMSDFPRRYEYAAPAGIWDQLIRLVYAGNHKMAMEKAAGMIVSLFQRDWCKRRPDELYVWFADAVTVLEEADQSKFREDSPIHRLRYVEYLVLTDVDRLTEQQTVTMENLVFGRASKRKTTIVVSGKPFSPQFKERVLERE
jgi:hypothetical protein